VSRKLVASILAVALLAAGALWFARSGIGDRDGRADTTLPVAAPSRTAEVLRTDLVVTEDIDGTLGFVAGDPIVNRLPGTVTALPAEGTTYGFGDVLYRIDTTPVVVAEGTIPMYRPLSSRSTDGPDIQQLEAMLVAGGYDPDGNIEIDEDFTSATRTAVENWQDALGMDDTGVVDLGRIVFVPAPIRVVEVRPIVGAGIRDGEIVATTSAPATKVTARLDTADQGLLSEGDAVVVELPDGRDAPATVTSVGSVAQRAPDGSSFLEVEIELDDPAMGEGLDEAPVTVTFETERAEEVLAVPVTALLALAEGGYAVEVVDTDGTHLVGVDTGTFADGLVEVVGDLTPGTAVVAP